MELATIALVLATGCGRTPVSLFEVLESPRCGSDDGDAFAQVVLGYEPTAGGGDRPCRDDVVDPEAALGPPDHQPTPPGDASLAARGTTRPRRAGGWPTAAA